MFRGIVLFPPLLMVHCLDLGIEQKPETKSHGQIEAGDQTVASIHETEYSAFLTLLNNAQCNATHLPTLAVS